jgi:hypothetical protein
MNEFYVGSSIQTIHKQTVHAPADAQEANDGPPARSKGAASLRS